MQSSGHVIQAAARATRIEYAIRDVVVPATELQRQGHEILKLNIGDPLAYPGLPTPPHMIEAYQAALARQENGYSPSYGIPALREAIAADETTKGWSCGTDDVYVCHGVTEALQLIFAAVLHEGDVVLAPGPHYPPYMAYPPLFGASTVEYDLNEDDGWAPDLADIRAKMDDRVKLLVLINPNNPTGNLLTPAQIEDLLSIARSWPNCLIIADEIYDGILFGGVFHSIAAASTDVPVLVLNGVSKVFYAPGWRIGYVAMHDPTGVLPSVRDGLERLLRSRLCASTPAQWGYHAGLTQPRDWMEGHMGRLRRQLKLCMERFSATEGIDCVRPGGAFYLFARLTDECWAADDKQFVLDLLHEEHVLCVHGSGFGAERGAGHVRMVFLPGVDVLGEAFDRIERFLTRHRV